MSVPSGSDRSAVYVLWCALVVLLSAFLLFQVQPVISKMILPWFGGSPAVWTTCMLFFQVLLLGGYAYAHWLSQAQPSSRRVFVHVALLGAALLLLPIIPGDQWKPTGSEHPTTRILLLLSVCVGLPYFALSTTGPLIQAWFARVCPTRSPYWLYALSNIGSLGALLTYPFVIEPWLTTRAQGLVWSVGFGLFALACGGLAVVSYRASLMRSALGGTDDATATADESNPKSELAFLGDRLLWLLLPTLSSVVLLAVTNHLCQDVAVVPFMWVAPLGLYLLTFIICFGAKRPYSRLLWGTVAAVSIGLVCALQIEYPIRQFVAQRSWEPRLRALEAYVFQGLEFVRLRAALERFGLNSLSVHDLNECIVAHATIYLTALFAICMVCHGELVRRKPPTRHLTSFYLMSSAGGALGGIIVALICPAMFQTYLELSWSLSCAFLVALLVLLLNVRDLWLSASSVWRKSLAVGGAVWFILMTSIAGFVAKAQVTAFASKDVATARSFYGVLHVEDEVDGFDESEQGRQLLNGRILHGFQLSSPAHRRQPTTYYTRRGGAGLAVETLRRIHAGIPAGFSGLFRTDLDDVPDPPVNEDLPLDLPGQQPLRVAVVGLGTGTMAAYGQAGDTFRFYEINPQVVHFARTYFSFLDDCPAEVEVVLGDARLSMEREPPQEFDVIVLDAFSGDAIPVHLLTDEAIQIYRRHMKPTGVIAIHVSNKHLDLIPVVATLARHHQMAVAMISNMNDRNSIECVSDWMLMTSNEEFLTDDAIIQAASGLGESRFQGPLWTDQHSNLFQILK